MNVKANIHHSNGNIETGELLSKTRVSDKTKLSTNVYIYYRILKQIMKNQKVCYSDFPVPYRAQITARLRRLCKYTTLN